MANVESLGLSDRFWMGPFGLLAFVFVLMGKAIGAAVRFRIEHSRRS